MEKINLILGTLEDVTGYFVLPNFVNLLVKNNFYLYGYPFGISESIFNYTEPLSLIFLYTFSNFLNPIIVFNFFIILTTALTIITSYKFFKIFIDNKFINSFLAIIFTTSPYLTYHFQSHPQLSQVWLSVCFLIYFLTYKKSLLKNFLMGIFLSLVFLTSNYLGFFTLIFISIYSLSEIIILVFKEKNKNQIKINVINYLSILIPFIIITLLWIKNVLSSNLSNSGIDSALNRSIDDFVTFGAKPWLYFIPPVDNFFLGDLANFIINFLKNNWGQFWTQNYFKEEMQGLFIGFSNLILIYFGIKYLIKNRLDEKYKNIFLLGITTLIIIIITLPPFFKIFGISIYLPSYLIWNYLPMFRVLSRVAYINYLIILTFSGLGAKYILSKYKSRGKYIVAFLLLFSFIEHLTPYKVTTFSEVPAIYKYIESIEDEKSFVVYPQSNSRNYFFWMTYHKKPITNPVGYKFESYDSKKLTQELTSCQGLIKAKELNVKYLIVYNKESENLKFKNSVNLKLIKSFSESDFPELTNYILFKVINASYVPKTFVYEIIDDINCQNNN